MYVRPALPLSHFFANTLFSRPKPKPPPQLDFTGLSDRFVAVAALAKVSCATAVGPVVVVPPSTLSPAPPSNPSDGRKTQMVQMWRVSEYNYTQEEDYLQVKTLEKSAFLH